MCAALAAVFLGAHLDVAGAAPTGSLNIETCGGAVNALVTAYERANLPRTSKGAPYDLYGYNVAIKSTESSFEVFFLPAFDAGMKVATVSVESHGTKPQAEGGCSDRAVLLPGSVAGEIVLVMQQAALDNRLSTLLGDDIQSGNYKVSIMPFAGGLNVAIIPQNPPKRVGTCIAGNCDYRTVYSIHLMQGHYRIQYHAIL